MATASKYIDQLKQLQAQAQQRAATNPKHQAIASAFAALILRTTRRAA